MTKVIITGKEEKEVRVVCNTTESERKVFKFALLKLGLTASDVIREAMRETIRKAKRCKIK